MQVRSITIGVDARWPLDPTAIAGAAAFFARAKQAFESEKVVVQTTRLCTQPAHEIVAPAQLPELAAAVQAACTEHAIAYASCGGIRLGGAWTEPAAVNAIVAAIASTDRVFASLQVAHDGAAEPRDATRGGVNPAASPSETGREGPLSIDFRAARAAAAIITQVAARTPQGFGNLRFAATAQCPPNIPFFPASWHAGGPSRFSLAVQAGDAVVAAFKPPGSLDDAEARLVAAIEAEAGKLERIATAVEQATGVAFAGIDLSPAPFPMDLASTTGGLEALGLDAFGGGGSAFAAWRLTRAVKRARVKQCGFSGLMLPVLEDSVLARRVGEGLVSVTELLLYSTLCGTGLDTVPLPGDVEEAELAGILLDIAALATQLQKPLTARLFPIPGKRAGDEAKFDFPFFVPSKVLAVKGRGAAALIRRALGEP